MNLYKIKAIAVATLLLTATSCQRYLDEPQPTDEISLNLAFSSSDNAEASLTGITSLLRRDITILQDGSNLGSIYFARSVRGEDFIVPNSWYSGDYQNTYRLATSGRTEFTWEYLYRIIRQCNEFITGVNQSGNISATQKNSLIARAKVLRALAYFEVVQDFQLGYKVAKNQPAVPIYDKYTKEANPLSTTEEVYKFITNDLETAIPELSYNRVSKAFINKQVAYAIAARVYQVKEDWQKAAEYAKLAYGGDVNASLNSAEYAEGFKKLDSHEWILGYGQQVGQSTYWTQAPHSFTDLSVVNNGYSNVYVSKSLYDLFSDTDVRKLFEVNPSSNNYTKYSTYKFTFNKDTSACPYIRTSEMILIEAEAKYRLGQESQAKDLLFQLQQNRDPKAVKSTNTGEALFNEILTERRKELYGEIGVEVYDARRLSLPLKRSSWHPVSLSFEVNDKKIIYQYPQQEIDANPHLSTNINSDR
ncbi:RagB/SusD family nutrient uptake outer membrane protein [Riemerella anatipestifer]|uniref:RagB/SusD family nutrient uptake outer membrane protein n=1 Tax=Riemerella anatipestifer TaxID=34085 RepID=UPI0012B2A702|nr:RagB/SusD family nutrient uptake outer membrane protein [Riemerella anatipestifer]MBT0549220.1 RagB/SusD family nutrient uptake outer membrane protein [Riemerella anatipestifer]MBT0555781.1 RagB/SusD family nutrient uptake outer membrane protein [Riemerella anatipestifer]MBT0559983.1 RagB/SusD family nutrient uptake outer membrane protein [Riemerella anatipestifer]MDY3338544.1 RagB/SusD family nutrient uptake outer membrane protein [Riemerella anatipestifer]MDY3525324.1 RagB/SusD family nut